MEIAPIQNALLGADLEGIGADHRIAGFVGGRPDYRIGQEFRCIPVGAVIYG